MTLFSRMNSRENKRLFRIVSRGFIAAFFFLKIFNNQILFSYFVGSLKFTWYNWTVSDFQDATCTLANPFFKPEKFMNERCISCESVTKIPKLRDTTYEEIEINYIKRNNPVIITDAMENWETVGVDIFRVTDAYKEQSWVSDYKPCSLLTNFDLPTDYILDYLIAASNHLSYHWFILWKNCDLRAVKIARLFYEQPYFVKYYLPAPKINWIIMSHRYNTQKYHEITIEGQKIIQFMQLRGSLEIKLLPRKKCRNTCPLIVETLNESEILLINSDLWSLHLKPPTNDISVVIITENEL